MSRFDDNYSFRLATSKDIDKIMQFIHDEWGEKHILANSKELFIWQYGATEYGDNDSIHFVIMEDLSGDMVGGIGYIVYSNDMTRFHVSPAMTMVRPTGMLPMAGLELMKRQMALVGEMMHFSHGTNPNTIKPLYDRVFHMETGIMQQFYMLNPQISEYRIADIKNSVFEKFEDTGYTLRKIASLNEADIDFTKDYSKLPYKSREFLNKRYFEHPIYKYEAWTVANAKGQDVGLLFGRVIEIDGAKVLRMVDFRGEIDDLYKLGSALNIVIVDGGYEYVDFFVSGLDVDSMKNAGFTELDVDGDNIIPNYFEPFVRENITLHYQKSHDVVIFKADGDQDRPNRL